MSKRTLEGFFTTPVVKRVKLAEQCPAELTTKINLKKSNHPTYPWPVPELPSYLTKELELLVTATGKVINDQPDLDLLYFQPFVPRSIERDLFEFLRSELFFYRVKYSLKRFGKVTKVQTPRYTSVFGVDETSRFIPEPPFLVDASDLSKPVPRTKYKCQPRPIPECLDFLRRVTEAATDTKYNFCLVNYYATGSDSISFHSDDERFLGPEPAIASFSLGARRDFLMKHKPIAPQDGVIAPETGLIKLPLASGDMVLMRGKTQSNWLHSIPKRKLTEGRINITFRKGMVPYATENYNQYNVGNGTVYRWSQGQKEMLPWSPSAS